MLVIWCQSAPYQQSTCVYELKQHTRHVCNWLVGMYLLVCLVCSTALPGSQIQWLSFAARLRRALMREALTTP